MPLQLVRNEEHAKSAVLEFLDAGYLSENIYILAHDKRRTETLREITDTNKVGLLEQGVFQTMANLFRSRGDELRAKMKALGLYDSEADHYERMLDQGDILVIAWPIDPDRRDRSAIRDADRDVNEPSIPMVPMGIDPNRPY